MNSCAAWMNANPARRFPAQQQHFQRDIFKTGIGCRPYLLKTSRHRRLSWHGLEQGIGYRGSLSPRHQRSPA
jgi:hypothetical protein